MNSFIFCTDLYFVAEIVETFGYLLNITIFIYFYISHLKEYISFREYI